MSYTEEKQRLEARKAEKLRDWTMSGLHIAFNVILDEVGEYQIKQWLNNNK